MGAIVALIGAVWTFIALWISATVEENVSLDFRLMRLQARKNALFAALTCAQEIVENVKNDQTTTFNSDIFNNTANRAWLGCIDNKTNTFSGWIVSGKSDKTNIKADSIKSIEENLRSSNGACNTIYYEATDAGTRPNNCKIEPTFLNTNTLNGGQKLNILNSITQAKNDFCNIDVFLKSIKAQELQADHSIGIYPSIIQAIVSVGIELKSSDTVAPTLAIAFVLWNPYSKPIENTAYILETCISPNTSSSQNSPELIITKHSSNTAQLLFGDNGCLSKIYAEKRFDPGEISCITLDKTSTTSSQHSTGVEANCANQILLNATLSRQFDFKCSIGDHLTLNLPATRISFAIKSGKDINTEYQKIFFEIPPLTKVVKIGSSNSLVLFYNINSTANIELFQLRSSKIVGTCQKTATSTEIEAIDAFGLSEFFDSDTENKPEEKPAETPWHLDILDQIPPFNLKNNQFASNSKIKPKHIYNLCKDGDDIIPILNAVAADLSNQNMPAFWIGEGRRTSPEASKAIATLNSTLWNKYYFYNCQQKKCININSTNEIAWRDIISEFFAKNNYSCSNTTIQSFAKDLIAEIKKRGPFKSVADFFVNSKKNTPGCFQKIMSKYDDIPQKLSQVKFAETAGKYFHSRSDSFIALGASDTSKNGQRISSLQKIFIQRKTTDAAAQGQNSFDKKLLIKKLTHCATE